ncbi:MULTISPECIES: hypothetical protein [unclassified Pseudomonas]|jgi:hypothetical protein|uniref:hypothetical protein n=1 Tax=unclassified Pseudomonas TaxID=196821 RepID=UPI0030D73B59
MATFCQEKFEQTPGGAEKKVCWRQDKHVHNATLITAIEIWLAGQFGGKWTVRANSYESGKQSCSAGSISYP